MWVKKSEWEEMKEQVSKIFTLQNQIEALNKNHETWTLMPERVKLCWGHKTTQTQTEAIPNVTFEELAQLIIDGKPITRKQEIEVEYS